MPRSSFSKSQQPPIEIPTPAVSVGTINPIFQQFSNTQDLLKLNDKLISELIAAREKINTLTELLSASTYKESLLTRMNDLSNNQINKLTKTVEVYENLIELFAIENQEKSEVLDKQCKSKQESILGKSVNVTLFGAFASAMTRDLANHNSASLHDDSDVVSVECMSPFQLK